MIVNSSVVIEELLKQKANVFVSPWIFRMAFESRWNIPLRHSSAIPMGSVAPYWCKSQSASSNDADGMLAAPAVAARSLTMVTPAHHGKKTLDMAVAALTSSVKCVRTIVADSAWSSSGGFTTIVLRVTGATLIGAKKGLVSAFDHTIGRRADRDTVDRDRGLAMSVLLATVEVSDGLQAILSLVFHDRHPSLF